MSSGTGPIEINTDSIKDGLYRLDSAIAATPATMRRVLTQMIIEVEREAKRYARSGGAFSSRSTGRLARSIGHQVSGSDIAILTTGVKYGMIQEFGGQTKAHEIRPRFAKALAFKTGAGFSSNVLRVGKGSGAMFHSGPVRFAAGAAAKLAARGQLAGMTVVKAVHHPGSRIPGTHYAQKSFAEKRETIRELAATAIRTAAGEGK